MSAHRCNSDQIRLGLPSLVMAKRKESSQRVPLPQDHSPRFMISFAVHERRSVVSDERILADPDEPNRH